MNQFRLAGDPRILLSHLALYGLASILEEAGVDELHVAWDGTATLSAPTLGPDLVDDLVRRHVAAHGRGRSWVSRDHVIGGEKRGLMSPRVSVLGREEWIPLQTERHRVLQELTDEGARLDLRLLAALGEPCYWSVNVRGDRLQDDGASRLEMQPRNRGSEIVTNRFRPLAENVAARPSGGIAAGLDGTAPVDELGGKSDSVVATGLTVPGPVDNAIVWCALWGIAQLPLAPRIATRAATSGHIGRGRTEWFYVPVWRGGWRTARLRSVVRSEQLRVAASTELPGFASGVTEQRSADAWLHARGVLGLVRFPIRRFGSDNAPERRAMAGEPMAIGGLRVPRS